MADGVMTAEGNLYNPALFTGQYPLIHETAFEYLNIVKEIGKTPSSAIKAHLFKILRPWYVLPVLLKP